MGQAVTTRRALGNEPASEHIVQLFDDAASAADALASFVMDGLEGQETVLVVADPAKWRLATQRSVRGPIYFSKAIVSGQLIVLDSLGILDRLQKLGGPDPLVFDQVVGTLVHRLGLQERRLRVYGDMVDRLAMEAEFKAAHELEELWNALMERQPFTLLCGYSAVHFGDPASGRSLRELCHSHSQVRTKSDDLLATFLLHSAVPGAAITIS